MFSGHLEQSMHACMSNFVSPRNDKSTLPTLWPIMDKLTALVGGHCAMAVPCNIKNLGGEKEVKDLGEEGIFSNYHQF